MIQVIKLIDDNEFHHYQVTNEGMWIDNKKVKREDYCEYKEDKEEKGLRFQW